jgi:DNA (cytosine-5)-methyltransferase 1
MPSHTKLGNESERLSDASNWAYGTSREFEKFWGKFLKTPRKPSFEGSPVTTVDLFASAGGLTLGAMTAVAGYGKNIQPLLAVDIDSDALEIYQRNFKPRKVRNESVANLVDFKVITRNGKSSFAYAPEATDSDLDLLKGQVDLLLAGPPCQGHSLLNNHSRFDDPRNGLYLTIPAVASVIKPKYIVIENVPTVTRDKSGVVNSAIGLLEESGYCVSSGVLSASDLGWPQTRKRFFIVASKVSNPLDISLIAEEMSRKPLSIEWAIGDLIDQVDTENYMTQLPQMSHDNIKRVNWLFDENEYNLANSQRPDCHKDGTTYTSVYGRMYWDKPAPTLTTGFLSPGRGRYVHPLRRRVLTPLEAARIQGFPDWFQFKYLNGTHATRTSLSKWIGDAVPSILGAIATHAAIGDADL